MRYLLIQFLIIFAQSAFGMSYEPLLDDIGPLSQTSQLIIKKNNERKHLILSLHFL